MDKLDGHIFQRLSPWVRRQIPDMTMNTLGNSRCRPILRMQLQHLETEFCTTHTRIARKIWRDAHAANEAEEGYRGWFNLGCTYALQRCLREATFPGLWNLWQRSDGDIIDEENVLALRPRSSPLVVTPRA